MLTVYQGMIIFSQTETISIYIHFQNHSLILTEKDITNTAYHIVIYLKIHMRIMYTE